MKALLFSVLILLCHSIFSQTKTLGLQIGYGSSKLLIDEEGNTSFLESSPSSSVYAGLFYRKSPSKAQHSYKDFFQPGITFGFGMCRSGGNFLRKRYSIKGHYHDKYRYLSYRAELTVLGELNYAGFKVFIGPDLYYPLYNTREVEKEIEVKPNLDEYEDGTLAMVAGLGYEYSILSLDIRYQRTLTDFGQRFKDQSFEFSERQWRLTLGLRLFKTFREKNNDSIFWE